MGSIDFDSEPAYWYEKVIRQSERNQLPVRSRPAASRDEALIAREVRRHVDRISMPTPAPQAPALPGIPVSAGYTGEQGVVRFCAACGAPFTRRAWRERRLWRVIYPRHSGRVELFRHAVCPVERQKGA